MTMEIIARGSKQPKLQPKPTRWTASMVAARLIEAYRTAARLPMRIRPQAYASSWPAYQTMTKAEMDQLLNELQTAGLLDDHRTEQNRVALPPSSKEIVRMEEAIVWPMRYLRDDQDMAAIVTGWVDNLLNHPYRRLNEIPPPVLAGFWMIAIALNDDAVEIR